MPVPDFRPPNQGVSTAQLEDYMYGFIRKMNDFLAHMDTLNIDELDAEVILANTITAEKISVSELSAISANLGHIMAGLIESIQIFGSYIATRKDAYPRAEMNSEGDLLRVAVDDENAIEFIADYNNNPVIVFRYNDVITARISIFEGALNIKSLLFSNLNIGSAGDIILTVAPGKAVKVDDWDKIYNFQSSKTLQSELNAKADRSSVTKTVYVSSVAGGPATTPLIISNGVVVS